jgi:hypothetical protein
MGHILMMLRAFEVWEGGFLSQFLMGSVVISVFKTPFARLGVKTAVSGFRFLIHWSTHPHFRRNGCDKGLEALEK